MAAVQRALSSEAPLYTKPCNERVFPDTIHSLVRVNSPHWQRPLLVIHVNPMSTG